MFWAWLIALAVSVAFLVAIFLLARFLGAERKVPPQEHPQTFQEHRKAA